VTADLSLAAAKVELAFRASLMWLLLLLPAGAALCAAGGLLSRSEAFPAPNPRRTFLATSVTAAVVLLASLPALAGMSPGGNQSTPPFASGEQSFTSPPSSEPPQPTTPNSPAPNEDATQAPTAANSEADPAFDPLIPTLRQRTSAPIMLPGDLPEELKNVAVDADQKGERYGILFVFEPSGNIVQSYVHANDAGTLTAAREPPEDATSEFFEATSEETVELPGGAEANLKYMEPKEEGIVNQGPFWEGSFEREGYTYTLRISVDDPSGDIARQALSTMVEVPDKGSSGGTKTEAAGDGARRNGPAPGYNLIQSPDGALSVEVPPSWGVETGEDSEKEAKQNTWSYFAGEYLISSITTAPSIDEWYSTGTSGAYMVASRALAQYSDYELTHSLFNASKDEVCTPGPYKDINRSPYSGKIQTWYDCGDDNATTYTVAAAPGGRECVVVLNARISDGAERKAIEHLVDSFEVDCGRVTSGPLPSPSATASPATGASPEAAASPEATPESSASASGSANAQAQTAGPAYNFIEVPRGTPPCPIGLDEVRAIYGPNVTCGEGGGYVPATGEE
jgi:hypothetical protein